MKTLIIIIWMVPSIVPSIVDAHPQLDIGFKSGPNVATQDHDFRVNRYGFSGGFWGNLQSQLMDRFSLGGQIELLYTPRGSETVFEGEHVGKLREHYLDLTVTTRPEARLGWASVYLLMGGGLNFLVSATRDDAVGAGQDITNGLHRVDVALLGAAGVAVHLPYSEPGGFRLDTIFLEARHDIGLLDVDNNGGFKNRTSALMLGLSVAVGGGPPSAPKPLQASR